MTRLAPVVNRFDTCRMRDTVHHATKRGFARGVMMKDL